MDQAIILFVAATMIALGVVMWGMRAGYWVFVVGVKSVVLLALIATAIVWHVSSAHAITQYGFNALYNAAAKQATALGVYPKRL